MSSPLMQLTLDGREVDRPARPRPLTDRQREVLRYVRAHGIVRPLDVGRMVHAGRSQAPSPPYYSSDGYDALRRLERRGLVTRQARGRWVAVVSGEGWG